jgi:group II intron reverse transcriptase/maturase
MHHINRETLKAAYHELDGKKAVGPDRVTKDAYGTRLDENVSELIERLRRMAYRPGPTRRVRIPKDGKPGATRPIDIGNFEDKLVQRAMARVIEAVYEPLFLGCSYGFRRGLGCHDAIRALYQYLYAYPVSVVIDVDLRNYFGTIRAPVLTAILREKIGDEKLVRYVVRMLKAGVLSGGELTVSEEGVPQGSPLSPVLANVVAHHVIDEWFETTVKAHVVGGVALFRYCDDLVICCADPRDGERIRAALARRLGRFELAMNEDKTRLVAFSKAKANRGERQESFDFLGFTFHMGRSRKGVYTPAVRTSSKRHRSKLKKMKQWVQAKRSRLRLEDLWTAFRQKIQGHIAYYAVSFNTKKVSAFVVAATHLFHRWLNRRGGRRPISWERFQTFMARRPLPRVKVVHPLYATS